MGKAEAFMPDPVSEALQPAFAFAPLRRGRFDQRRSARPAVPGFRRRPGPPSSPSVGSNRTQAPDPPRHARGANSVALPPDLSPGRELPDTGPFATWRQGEPCIFRRRVIRSRASSRTSTLRSLEPEQAPSSTAGSRENRNPLATRFRQPSVSKRTSILPAAGPEPDTEAP